MVPGVRGECVSDVERGQQVEATHVGEDQCDCEDHCKPTLLERDLDVVRGAADGMVVS